MGRAGPGQAWHGQEREVTLGNGLKEYRSFYARTGRLNTLLTEPSGGGTDVQSLTLTYDEVGNLKTRDDATIGIGEDFVYDSLNRLSSATVDYQSAKSASYSAAGDINSKTECGTYYYASRPHLVTGTSACESSFTYDASSRMITRGSGEIDWYTYDLPSRIDDPTDTAYSQFWYGPDRSRIKQYQSDTGATITYVGELFEYEDTASTDTARYYVHAGSRVVAMVERVGSTNTMQYLHRDQQGSVTKITSSGGSVTQALAYDAWGLRRNASTWAALSTPFAGSHETERGYTGHEHLDNVGLVHMNGRVQDPRLGRFISADPFIQAPYLTQSHNRFAYVMNNPASLVDPSGFWWQNQLSPELYYPGHDVHMAAVNADYKAVPVFAPNPNAGSFDGPNNGGGNVVVGWDLVPDEQPFLDDTELQKQAEILRLQLEFGIVTIPWYNEAGAGLGVATNMRLPVPRTGLAVELYPRGWVPQSGSTSTLFIQDATGKTHLRLDRGYNIRTGQIDVHWNQRGTYDLFGIRNHTSVRGGSALYFGARGLRALGRGSLIGATATDVYAIATAEDKSREVVRAAGGWAGAMAGAKLLGSGGALLGSAEPGGGTIAGALAGGVVGGVVGYFGGEEAALAIYGWFTSE